MKALSLANAHFSEDILSLLLNEPIPGNGVLWSSVDNKSYPLNMRVNDFGKKVRCRDPEYSLSEGNTFVVHKRFQHLGAGSDDATADTDSSLGPPQDADEAPKDTKSEIEKNLIDQLKEYSTIMGKLESEQGVATGEIKAFFKDNAPEWMDNAEEFAYNLVKPALNIVCGKGEWEMYYSEIVHTSFVKRKKKP